MSPHFLIVFVDNADENEQYRVISLIESIVGQTVPPAAVVFCTTAPLDGMFLPAAFPSFSAIVNSRTLGAFICLFLRMLFILLILLV